MATKLSLSLFLCPLLILINSTLFCDAAASYNVVMRFGAKPNGQSDSTEAFLQAWAAACASTESALIYVPKGRYLLRPLIFLGPCKSPHIMFRIDGTLVAPTDYRVLGGVENWINFKRVSSVTILGGSLDAKGPALWACKAKPNNSCPTGATTLTITYSNNIKIVGLLSLNSQMFHITINHCENVEIKGVRILAKENSPNTDGIHLQFSKNIAIFNSSVKTGDDCVSIGPGTQNLLIQRMACGPGHGISIGSLAKELEEEGVRNITVKEVVFTETQNGVRIKSWARPSLGFVKEVQFFNIVMRNVRNPIIIDQNYCPHSIDCPNQVSGTKISDIVYRNIKGTSTKPIVMKFDCSSKYPCTGIVLEDVNLTSYDDTNVTQSVCAHAHGKSVGLVLPSSCLLK
ncbi:hypothetical protein CsatB_000247 [Cannabis sativa]